MDKVEVETVIRLHTSDAILEIGTDPDTSSCVEIRTPDQRSRDFYGDVRLTMDPEIAATLAYAILRIAETLEGGRDE